MPVKINYLSIDLNIGGHNIQLVSDKTKPVADLPPTAQSKAALLKNQDATTTALKKSLLGGLAFKMEEGKVITVTIKQLIAFMDDKFSNMSSTFKSFCTSAMGGTTGEALDGIEISIWNLEFSTRISFSFCMKLALKDEFYNAIIPETLQDIRKVIQLNSIGFGLEYTQAIIIPPDTKEKTAEETAEETDPTNPDSTDEETT